MTEVASTMIFSQEQIDHLSSLHFINNIDSHLRIVSSINIAENTGSEPPRITLSLEIYYDDKKVDTLSFDLHNYGYEDIIHISQNIRSNEFLLQEVDNFLSGGME